MRNYRLTALLLALVLTLTMLSTAAAARTETYYDVDVVVTGNGDAWTNVKRAHAGDTVSITARPDHGYELANITVIAGDSLWEVTWNEDNDWWFEPSRWFAEEDWTLPDVLWDNTVEVNRWNRFTMPQSDVTVWVTFTDGSCDGSWPNCPSYRFNDVPADAWYHEAVDYVLQTGYMDGVSKTRFDPDGGVTRAMTWLVLGRVSGYWNLEGGSPWYADAQDWVKAHKISDGKNPTAEVTREELVTMLYRWYGSPQVHGTLGYFYDGGQVSSWAEKAMVWAIDEGLLGVGGRTLAPQRITTRAELASILQRLNTL